VLVTLPFTPSSARAALAGLALVLAPLGAGSACIAAWINAPREARPTWAWLTAGSVLATVGQALSARAWLSLEDVVPFPSAPFLLFVGFHICLAEGAILALRPARDQRLAIEIALDGVLVLLASAMLVLRFQLDQSVSEGWLPIEQAAGLLLGQMSVAGSLLFTGLLVLWRDSELPGASVDALFVGALLFLFGNALITMGLDPMPGRSGDVFEAIRFTGWLAMTVAALIAARAPAASIVTERRASVARWMRLLIIPAAAIFLAGWAVDAAARRGVTTLSAAATVALGLVLAARVSVALYAVEREADERRRAEGRVSLARLRAVTARMNPHFLFNALHSLSALLRRDARAAEGVLERLGGLLRYGLDQGDAPVPLADEWQFASDYARLEQVRLGERLRFEGDIDPAALEHMVPPFVIQPLVENAIRHAIDRDPAGGLVRVRAWSEASVLTIEVWDSGPGAALAQLDNARGVGLRGVRAQLEAHHGPHAVLAAERPPAGGFVVRIELPLADG